MVPQRRVFHVYTSKITSDESLDRQHIGAVYHRGSSQILSTTESHGGDLIILREPDKSEDKAEYEAKENRIGASPAIRWRRPCMRVAVCLSIDQGELVGGHNSVEVDDPKGQGSDDESSGAQLPKSKASARKEVNSEKHDNATEAVLPIANEGM
ncbi:hypothetical protein B296_00027609 [Ensete ventricosum]|uniref:Uncharacterized protein n=1 Tax=Ensete ventricosum TaxID=4639 RepID=A0A426Y0C5_ENSVE|nr:hypothetical protein B296_00027609 [Ensete ventricosum]